MKPNTSIICPIKDEEKNILLIFKSLTPMYGPTECIFSEGGSSDSSWPVIQNTINKYNHHGVYFRGIRVSEKGKALAVEKGFDAARGKYLVILDADLSIGFSDLQKCLNLFKLNGNDIIAAGNRLKGFRKPKAFYWINYMGNYFFRYYYSFILRQPILDISCGTKAMTKYTWKKIKLLRKQYGALDSWGDIDWLYYGIRSGARPVFTDVSYKHRRFGVSKLQNLYIRYSFAFRMFTIGLQILSWR